MEPNPMPAPTPSSALLTQTSALLDDVADEVREALHQYDKVPSDTDGEEAGAGAGAGAGEGEDDGGVASELMEVYAELAVHRKGVTRLMAKVKRCAQRAERAAQPTAPTQRGKAKGKATGLTKPYPVSSSLCAFVGVPEGTEMARAEVTKYLHQYIKDKNLAKGQYVVPDHALKSLLALEADDQVHLFAMQKRMNAHFVYPNKRAVGVVGVGAI